MCVLNKNHKKTCQKTYSLGATRTLLIMVISQVCVFLMSYRRINSFMTETVMIAEQINGLVSI